MKKSYSRINLLQAKLEGLSDSKGILGYLFTNRRYIEIEIPYYSYIRGKIFVEDLRDNYGDEVPISFDVGYLIYMLYTDFLSQIKKGLKNEDIAAYLLQGKEKHFKIAKKERRVMRALTRHLLEVDTLEDEIEVSVPDNEKTACIELRMRESKLLRAEVLIHDLQPYLKGSNLTVEQIIAIIYLDFISNIKNEGNSVKVQKSILAHIHSDN